MNENVIRFPGAEPPPETEPEETPPTRSFEDFVHDDVVDFCDHAKDLADTALMHGEDEFWNAVEELKQKINGWTRA